MSNLNLPNLSVQINQDCNLACAHCGFQAHLRRHANDRPLNMGVAFFEEIIGQYRSYAQERPKYLSLSAGGEPLMHPAFLALCERADRAGLPFGLDTNATLLNGETARALLSLPHFKRIVFSIDGFKSETYESIRRGADFDAVHAQVIEFLRLARQCGRGDLHTRVNMVLQERNAGETEEFIRYWAGRVSQVNVSSLRVGTRIINPRFLPAERSPCRFLWDYTRVLTDGRVVICCVDDKFTSVIGDLRDQRLAELWQGARYRELRERQTHGDFSDPAMCSECTAWAGFLPGRKSTLMPPCTVVEERPANLVAVNLPLGPRAFVRYLRRHWIDRGSAGSGSKE